MKSLTFYCKTNTTTNLAFDEQLNAFTLPFNIKLNQFTIDEYSPTLVLVDNKTGEINKIKSDFTIAKDKSFKLNLWKIRIDEFIPYAQYQDNKFVPFNAEGSLAAARVTVENEKQGWISSGNKKSQPMLLPLDNAYSLAITVPQPKRFQSDITLNNATEQVKVHLRVNKPFSFKGWELYQTGYDIDKGKW